MARRARTVSVTLALVLLAVAFPAPGQQPAKVYRIGYLGGSLAPSNPTPQQCPIKGEPRWQALIEGCGSMGISWAKTSSSSAAGLGAGRTAPRPSPPNW